MLYLNRKAAAVRSSLRLSAVFLVSLLVSWANAGVLLQGFYWDVPSPAADSPTAPWWYDKIAAEANALKLSGFTAVWIPPVLKGASGGYSVGYDPFDDYDMGSKDQMGTIPTRYGTREQLQRMCAMLRANSLDIYADIVANHRNGDDGNYNFNYVGAAGLPNTGRFGKSALDFHPNVPQDPNVPDGPNEISFGRDVAHINGAGGWMFTEMIQAGDWMTKALDLQGYRLDYVKGISTDWLKPFLNTGAMSGKFAVGEYFDGNLGSVQSWLSSMEGRASAFDFPLRDKLRDMCNNPGSFDMSTLDHAGLAGVDPFKAVTFVENHDTDVHDPIVQNKALAYAYILTSEGYPSVFYKDYSTDPGNYGMKPIIDNLMWIHENLASGTTVERWKNNLVFVYERTGGQKLLVGLNNNIGFNYVLTCATGFGPNVQLHDYTGHAPDVWTDSNGNVTLDLPPAINGLGYVCYAPAGIPGNPFTAPHLSTTQEYAGAADLDIQPAGQARVRVARIYAAAGETVTGSLFYDTSDWNIKTRIRLMLMDESGNRLAFRDFFKDGMQGWTIAATPQTTGWYTFYVYGYDTPEENPAPNYWLKATYKAPQTFPAPSAPKKRGWPGQRKLIITGR